MNRNDELRVTDYLWHWPKQQEAFKYVGKGFTIFYGGAKGGGKSRFAFNSASLACLQFPGLRTCIVRKTLPELRDVFISKIHMWLPKNVFDYKWYSMENQLRFGNGSIINFRGVQYRSDEEKLQGTEWHLLIIDEAPLFRQDAITTFAGSVRNTEVPGFKATYLLTGNPGGISDFYFMTRFVSPDYKYWEPREKKLKDKYVFVPATVDDNPSMIENDPGYIEWLDSLPKGRYEALRLGKWNNFNGQYFEEWDEEVHVVEEFQPPPAWERCAGLDLGYSKEHPTVCLWAAQNPKTLDVYIYDEYVGTGPAEAAIPYLKDKEDSDRIMYYADPSMWNSTTKNKYGDESPARMYIKEGIPLKPAQNRRINGWRTLKQWLHWSQKHKPKLYICNNCPYLIKTLPLNRYNNSSQINAEDLDTEGPDDAVDALRYLLVSGFDYPTDAELKELEGLIEEEQESEYKKKSVDIMSIIGSTEDRPYVYDTDTPIIYESSREERAVY